MTRKQWVHDAQEHRVIEEDEDTVEDTEDSEYPKDVQCQGEKADGTQCERTVTLESEDDEPYCFQHE